MTSLTPALAPAGPGAVWPAAGPAMTGESPRFPSRARGPEVEKARGRRADRWRLGVAIAMIATAQAPAIRSDGDGIAPRAHMLRTTASPPATAAARPKGGAAVAVVGIAPAAVAAPLILPLSAAPDAPAPPADPMELAVTELTTDTPGGSPTHPGPGGGTDFTDQPLAPGGGDEPFIDGTGGGTGGGGGGGGGGGTGGGGGGGGPGGGGQPDPGGELGPTTPSRPQPPTLAPPQTPVLPSDGGPVVEPPFPVGPPTAFEPRRPPTDNPPACLPSPCPAEPPVGGEPTRVTAPAPEPGVWAVLITGFGLVGCTLRRRRRQRA